MQLAFAACKLGRSDGIGILEGARGLARKLRDPELQAQIARNLASAHGDQGEIEGDQALRRKRRCGCLPAFGPASSPTWLAASPTPAATRRLGEMLEEALAEATDRGRTDRDRGSDQPRPHRHA